MCFNNLRERIISLKISQYEYLRCSYIDRQNVQGYNCAIEDVLTLLDETLDLDFIMSKINEKSSTV